jgi:hypothetical protein
MARTKVLEFTGVVFTMPTQPSDRRNLLYNKPIVTPTYSTHEFYSVAATTYFPHVEKPLTGRIAVNTNVSLRRHPLGLEDDGVTLKLLGPKCPLAGQDVVCDGWIEEIVSEAGQVRYLRVLFATDTPLASATHELRFPKVADEAMREGDVRMKDTAHVIRLEPIRKQAAQKSA